MQRLQKQISITASKHTPAMQKVETRQNPMSHREEKRRRKESPSPVQCSPIEDDVKCDVMYAMFILAFGGGENEMGRRGIDDPSTAV